MSSSLNHSSITEAANLVRRGSRYGNRSRSRKAPSNRLALHRAMMDALESRLMLSTFLDVTTNADSGPGSLRQAILDANNTAGADEIDFKIGTPGSPQTITVASALPNITEAVTINGLTQGGTDGAPVVTITPSTTVTPPVTGNGLTIAANGCTIEGLAITGFTSGAGIAVMAGTGATIVGNDLFGNWSGIDLESGANIVQSNVLGMDTTVSPALDAGNIVGIVVASDGNLIGSAGGGNVVADGTLDNAEFGHGILVTGNNTVIQANLIGTDVTGTTTAPNVGNGIEVDGASGTLIGGADPATRNIIAGNGTDGVAFFNPGTGNQVIGNYIGLTETASPMGNDTYGVYVTGGGVTIAQNVISANGSSAILLDSASGNLVQGNYIGTDPTGTLRIDFNGATFANYGEGVGISGDSSNNTIGGSNVADRNIIANTYGSGVQISGGGSGNVVQGNYIGTDVSGLNGMGNSGNGIQVEGGGVQIIGNVIAAGGDIGIQLGTTGSSADGNSVQGNKIGVGADGLTALGNFHDGISINGSNNQIGGITPNIIAFNGSGASVFTYELGGTTYTSISRYNGITIDSGTDNAIRGNAIYGNATADPDPRAQVIGIDLNRDGPTSNDSNGHTGPNNFQDYPNIATAIFDSQVIRITGTMPGQGTSLILMDFFANPAPGANEAIQGQTYLGSFPVLPGASFTVTFPAPPTGQVYITATATDAQSNTSELSAPFTASEGSLAFDTQTTLSSSLNPSTYGDAVTFDAVVSVPGMPDVPAGTVAFYDGASFLGEVTLANGDAKYTTGNLVAGTHDIKAVYIGNDSFKGSRGDVTQVVNKADAIISIGGYSGVYDGHAHGATGSATALDGTDLSSLLNLGASFTNVPGGTANWTFAGNDNYNSASGSVSINITPVPITVTANTQSKMYGSSDPALTYQVTGTLVGTDGFSGTLTRVAGENVGTYAIGQSSLSLSGNYDLTFVGNSLTITPRPISVTADAYSKVYGTADPALTYQVTGTLVGTDSFSGALTRVAGENVGAYAIEQGALALSTNYDLTFVGSSLTIAARAITVTANQQTKTYGDSDPALTYAITRGILVNGDSLLGSLGRDPGENVGPYAINQNTLALSANYALTFVGSTLTITTRPITVTADGQTKAYGNADPALTYQVTGALIGTDSFSGALARVAGENVGSYAITEGSLSLSSNYALSFSGAMLTISARPISVSADAQTKVYGNADPALTYQVTGALVGTDTFSGALARVAGENVGSYAIQQGTLALNSNYALSFSGASLTVTQRAASVTPDAASKVYDSADPVLTGTLSGFLPADGVTAMYSRAMGETASAQPYLITAALSPLDVLSNYNITYNTAPFTITKANATIDVSGYSGPYDGNAHGASGTATGASGEDLSGLLNLGAAYIDAGSYTANWSFAGDVNHFAASGAVSIKITPISATVTVYPVTAAYDGQPHGTTGIVTGIGGLKIADAVITYSTTNGSAPVTPGNYVATGTFAGNNDYTAASGSALIKIGPGAPVVGSVSGYVFLDVNNDGVRQTSELGIGGVGITLSGNGITPVTVQTLADGSYSFANLMPGTYTITDPPPAGYIAGKNNTGVFSNVSISGGANGSYDFPELQNILTGRVLSDITGNGLTPDDTPLTSVSVQVNLYKQSDNSLVTTTTQDSNGVYSFVDTAPGNYYVKEIVPTGYVRTVPVLSDNYAVTVAGATNLSGLDFDNYKQCLFTVSNVSFTITSTNGTTQTVTDLRGHTRQGDTVTVTFTLGGTLPAVVTLVSYDAPGPTFVASDAAKQTIFQQDSVPYTTPGTYTLQVTIPNNYYQIDFVKCFAIDQFGPAGSNIFYSAQGRLISADNAGLHSDVEDQAAATQFWAGLGQSLIGAFNGGGNSTALGNWLANNYKNLYGASGANNLSGKNNAAVAAFFMKLYNDSTRKTDAEVVATALNVYASTNSLGGTWADDYGFKPSDGGLGVATFNVLSDGAAFGVSNNSTLSVAALLQKINAKATNDVLYKNYSNIQSLLAMAYDLFHRINTAGGLT